MNSLSCPWSEFARDTFPDCEASVCGWIRQPANTWSNLIYFLIGLYLLSRSRKSKGLTVDAGLGWGMLIVGICSTLAHASLTHFFGFCDFAAIFIIFSYLLSFNLRRHTFISSRRQFIGSFFAVWLLSTLVLWIWTDTRVPLFAIFIAVLLAFEFIDFKRSPELDRARWKLLLTSLIGFTALGLDASKTLCESENHFFQLHSLWHVAMGFSTLYLADYLNLCLSLDPPQLRR